jgi:dihydrofolate reductase
VVFEQAFPDAGAMDLRPVCLRPVDPEWGPNGPLADKRLPLVVITHSGPTTSRRTVSIRCRGAEIEAALEEARDRFDGGDIAIVGGPIVGKQHLRAGPRR